MVNIVFETEKNRAAAYDGQQNIGESTISKSASLWIIDHTLVDEGYGGQGIAGRLVAEIVNQARIAGVKIIPLCPFAKREFEKKIEYADVLAK
ncbi:GNAT family N-acetyltransferase [Veillonella criceti]|uniref:N-acetyltransferase domain-containing protein n=1 Tax=Veillonella criceti TaxID=103891 RepID=A0A380NJ86_9FIRM|nr:GNAT family N-acetyltransferase [Veillonella criceti]SUP41683.1 Uncharacterised protein [Veillonella criceti]